MTIRSLIRLLTLPALALFTLLLFMALPYESALVESWYSRGLFVAIRHIWDGLLGWIPIPLIYIWIIISILLLRYWYRRYDTHSRLGFFIYKIVWPAAQLISLSLVLFYWLWAYNYKRINPLADKLDLQTMEMTEDDLYEELYTVTDSMIRLREMISTDPFFDWESVDIDWKYYREELEQMFADINLPAPSHVNVRLLYPKGSLLHISTAGVYLPWASEGHIDPGLHPITWPFTMTHEMSHGYGYTSEDRCNFFALLSCVRSDDPFMRYSGYFGYWRYLRSNAYRADCDRYHIYWEDHVPATIKEDLRALIRYHDQYPDIMPVIRDVFYDQYLRSHGVSEGLRSYSRIIRLAHAWQQQYGSLHTGG